jgi:hypothetical protein
VARYLANAVGYPAQRRIDLDAVSQFYALIEGQDALRNKLHSIFDADFAPTALHRLLAILTGSLRAKGYTFSKGYPLIVTTSFDDCLERAFREAGEEFDLLTYVGADWNRPQRFVHQLPNGEIRPVEEPNRYMDVSLEKRCAILKVYGAVDRRDVSEDSYVVAEDNYIDFPSEQEIATLIPGLLAR